MYTYILGQILSLRKYVFRCIYVCIYLWAYIYIHMYIYIYMSKRASLSRLVFALESTIGVQEWEPIFNLLFCRLLRRCKEADMKVVEKLLAQDQAMNSTFAVTSNSHLRGTLGSTLPKSTRYVSCCVCVCIYLFQVHLCVCIGIIPEYWCIMEKYWVVVYRDTDISYASYRNPDVSYTLCRHIAGGRLIHHMLHMGILSIPCVFLYA